MEANFIQDLFQQNMLNKLKGIINIKKLKGTAFLYSPLKFF